MKRLSISIDLDPLKCYYDIHGIEGYDESGIDPIYSTAIERIFTFFDNMGIKPTLFVVGEQLGNDYSVDLLRSAVDKGYEIGNHTYSHRYDFSLLEESQIEEEINRCRDIISKRLSIEVEGFRAPGYNINRNVVKRLIESGYKYDSSLLPSPFYYFAKAGVILLYRLTGRKTRSICGSIYMPFGRREPYFTDENRIYSEGDNKILELPISVAGFSGLPYVGTFIMGYRDWFYNYLMYRMRRMEYLHIELHGIDFLDKGDIRDERLLRSQFDINVPLDKKLNRLKSLIERFDPEEFKRLKDINL